MTKKTLIAYYSHSGNTRTIADLIRQFTNGSLFEILPEHPYPENYNQCVEQAKREISSGFKPELKSSTANLETYEVVFVGSPNWWSTIAPPVASFLSNLSKGDLSGKTIVPFITHGGGGVGRCVAEIKKLVPNATVAKELYLSGSSVNKAQTEVEKWVKEI
jgi:flavodoxin